MGKSVMELLGLEQRSTFDIDMGLENYLLHTNEKYLSDDEKELKDYCKMTVGDSLENDMTYCELVERVARDESTMESMFIALEFMSRYGLEDDPGAGAPPAAGSTAPQGGTGAGPEGGDGSGTAAPKKDTGKLRAIGEKIKKFFGMIINAIKAFINWIVGFVKKIAGWIADRCKGYAEKAKTVPGVLAKIDQTKVIVKGVRVLNGDPSTIIKEYEGALQTFFDKIKNFHNSMQGNLTASADGLIVGGQNISFYTEGINKIKNEELPKIDPKEFKNKLYTGKPADTSVANYKIQPNNYLATINNLVALAENARKNGDMVGKEANGVSRSADNASKQAHAMLDKMNGNAKGQMELANVYKNISQMFTKMGGGLSTIATECGNILGDIDKFMNAISGAARAAQQQQQQPAANANQAGTQQQNPQAQNTTAAPGTTAVAQR